MAHFSPTSLRIPHPEAPNNVRNVRELVQLMAHLRAAVSLRLNYKLLYDFVEFLLFFFIHNTSIVPVLAAVLQEPKGFLVYWSGFICGLVL